MAGPLFTRELLTTARQTRHYLLRGGVVLLILAVLYTANQVVFGWQGVRTVGDTARFGAFVFGVLAVLELTVAMGVALLASASTVSTEKDRRTLVLLLMTDLSGRELVVGKMLAALINVVTLILVVTPALLFVRLLGGFTVGQVLALQCLCLSAGLMTAAWATMVAYWREKTFQTLAVAALGTLALLAVTGEASLLPGAFGRMFGAFNPYVTMGRILNPLAYGDGQTLLSLAPGLLLPAAVGVGLLLLAVVKVRVWNPPRVVHQQAAEGESARVRPPRNVWATPILWREVRTLAYGRKTLVVKAVYLILAGGLAYAALTSTAPPLFGVLPPIGLSLLAMSLVSLLLINAQAVTSLTTERDGQTLELLLVTEVPAGEFIRGKLLGALWNAKELIAAPLALIGVGYARGLIGGENAVFLTAGLLTLVFFSAMLGLHFGLTYGSSRRAIATSLGTITFLFLGIFLCMLLIVEGRSSFALQFPPFLAFILGGSIALWAALTARTPSPALTFAALVLPFLTFYALTSFLLGDTLGVALAVVAAYGFTAIAMYVPAISEYIVTLGRGGPGD